MTRWHYAHFSLFLGKSIHINFLPVTNSCDVGNETISASSRTKFTPHLLRSPVSYLMIFSELPATVSALVFRKIFTVLNSFQIKLLEVSDMWEIIRVLLISCTRMGMDSGRWAQRITKEPLMDTLTA